MLTLCVRRIGNLLLSGGVGYGMVSYWFSFSEMLEVVLNPRHCICPDDGYTCVVRQGTELEWIVNDTDVKKFTFSEENETFIDIGGFKVDILITKDFSIFSTLLVTDLSMNGNNLTCQSVAVVMNMVVTVTETTRICVIGKYTGKCFKIYLVTLIAHASSPNDLSVVYDSSSSAVIVSFKPPVHGSKCVDYYVVSAISEEETIVCYATTDNLVCNCSIPPDRSVNSYNFSVYPVTSGVGDITYNGDSANDCSELAYSCILCNTICMILY